MNEKIQKLKSDLTKKASVYFECASECEACGDELGRRVMTAKAVSLSNIVHELNEILLDQ